MKILILGMILFLNNCNKTQTSWEIKGVNQEEISFRNNKVLKTNLFDLKFLFLLSLKRNIHSSLFLENLVRIVMKIFLFMFIN